MNTDIDIGSRVLNPDGDLCVVTGMKNETAGNRSWWVSIIPGRLSLPSSERVSITRRWYDEKNLRLLVPLPKRSEPGKPPVDPFLEMSYAAWRIGYQSSEAAARAAFFKLASSTQTAPAVLFDGEAVYLAMTPKAKARTSPENVSDTLDAVVRILRGTASPTGRENDPWTS